VAAGSLKIGNRFCILPMEGSDSDLLGRPTPATTLRWQKLGLSGAKLIWAEATAVRPDGRWTARQLLAADHTVDDLASLRRSAIAAHEQAAGDTDGLVIGLQLTHSGRYSRPSPSGKRAPVSVRHHPYLDTRFGPAPDQPLLTDDQLHELCADFVRAAGHIDSAGFDFVDIKSCHGYLGHELLAAFDRPGQFGGSLDNRTRFLRTIVGGIRAAHPRLAVAVRLSAFDTVPFVAGHDGVGRPVTDGPYRYSFGTDPSGHHIDLSEPVALLEMLRDLGVSLVCITGASPYTAHHYVRPEQGQRCGGYLPPEDPLVAVARHLQVTATLKAAVPQLTVVGSGYSYLQHWLPHVAQATVRTGMTDLVGVGRAHLAYTRFPADVLLGAELRPYDWAAL
jgi:2,4-dienoyl-CoA reductase-like NADH-dependent reductase (Old Yellow Enzyme family)